MSRPGRAERRAGFELCDRVVQPRADFLVAGQRLGEFSHRSQVRSPIASRGAARLGKRTYTPRRSQPSSSPLDCRWVNAKAVASKMFLFKTFPAFTSFDPPPKAGGHMLCEPWQRVGHPPLLLIL